MEFNAKEVALLKRAVKFELYDVAAKLKLRKKQATRSYDLYIRNKDSLKGDTNLEMHLYYKNLKKECVKKLHMVEDLQRKLKRMK